MCSDLRRGDTGADCGQGLFPPDLPGAVIPGFMKALVGERDDRILGFTMIGATAGEVMAAVHAAMLAGLSYSSLANADFAHPTMAEGLTSLFSSMPPRAMQQTKSKAA